MLVAKRYILLLLITAVASVAAFAQNTAYAQNPVGEMELEKGVVKVRRADRDLYFRKLKERTPVFAGDELHSGSDTRAKIFFRDGRDTISLYSRSLFKIEEVSERRSFFGISIGKAFFKVLSKFRKNKFTVQTPTATIGIKGTEFVAATDGVRTFVLTTEGVVGLANVDFPGKEVLVKPNQASTVEPNTAPAPPVEVEPEDQADIIQEEGTETFEELPFQIPPEEPPPGEEQNEEEQEEEAPPDTTEISDLLDEVDDSVESVKPSGDVGTPSSPVNINVTR